MTLEEIRKLPEATKVRNAAIKYTTRRLCVAHDAQQLERDEEEMYGAAINLATAMILALKKRAKDRDKKKKRK